jgi:glycosyltransferase involved in cell wall biosynthesis
MKHTFLPITRRTDFDVVCFSHLRWDFVFQRPQHLMTRFAFGRRLFFIEEPVFHDGIDQLEISERGGGVMVCLPRIAHGTPKEEVTGVISDQVQKLLADQDSDRYIAWFYTPMMLDIAVGLDPLATIYDCMDELSGFRGAPPELCERERLLMEKADLVFTGGHSLYEAKRSRHHSVHAFPSSVEVSHFGRALEINDDPSDQELIPHPRIGFAGVIDERLDIDLLGKMAELRPDWQFVMIGPVVKISEDDLPRRTNIHYLGMKAYDQLPGYLAGWDVAIMPFALNESTKYISPTKTPEYLAAGLPVVSTPITDVVRPYGEMGLVHIASTAEEFVAGIDAAMQEDAYLRMQQVNGFLSENSWDRTFEAMSSLIKDVIGRQSEAETTVISLDNTNHAGTNMTAVQGEIYV